MNIENMNLTFTDVELFSSRIVDDEILKFDNIVWKLNPYRAYPKKWHLLMPFDFEDEFPMDSMQR